MRASILLLLATACSSTGAEPAHAGSAARAPIVPVVASAVPRRLGFADLTAVEGQNIFPATLRWNDAYAELVRRFGPVTRVVDRKYFWAAAQDDRCAMFWIGKRLGNQVAIAVGVMSTERDRIGYAWCIAMVTGGALPPTERSEPSTGFDTPTPD